MGTLKFFFRHLFIFSSYKYLEIHKTYVLNPLEHNELRFILLSPLVYQCLLKTMNKIF